MNKKKLSPKIYQSSSDNSEDTTRIIIKENFKTSSYSPSSNNQELSKKEIVSDNESISQRISNTNNTHLSDSNTNTDSNSNISDKYFSKGTFSDNQKYKVRELYKIILMYAKSIKTLERKYTKQKKEYKNLEELLQKNKNENKKCDNLLIEKNKLKESLKKDKTKIKFLLKSFANINIKMSNDI